MVSRWYSDKKFGGFNGQVPPGQTEDGDGNIVNNGGNMAPGLNRGEKIDKPENPNKPEKPENPGSEDKDDKKANKANKGTHIYTYDELNRMVSSNIAKVLTEYTYDTLGNLVLETSKNKSVDYEYNELNQLVKKTTSQNEVYTYSYDKRGNRTAETGKKASQSFVYDATNRMVEGTNWKGDKSAYTYNGLGLRVNNLVTTHAGKTYDRDYVIDYTSPENDDRYVYAMGNGQLEYEQRHVYAGSERLEQITEKGKGGWERTLYVHEDVMGNTRYYTKTTGQSFAELQYDAWGQPDSPNKLVNNDHGNYVFATFTGHTYDPVLDIYFAEARFYDATNRTWMARDPAKDGLNWYQYALSNPTTYWDPSGLWAMQNKTNNYYTLLSCEGENPIQEFLDGIVDWFVGIFQRGKEVIRWGGGSANSGAGAGRNPKPSPTPTPTPTPSPTPEAQFVGYLAYGATSITQSREEGFFALYSNPTLPNATEQYYFADLYEEYGESPYGALQAFGDYDSALNTYGDTKYGGQELDPVKGTLTYNGIERYAIALGPKLQNPNFEEGKVQEISGNDMAYGTAVDVSIVLDDKTYYIPAIIVDIKEHTYPTGVFQSGVSFSAGSNAAGHESSNIVEWYTLQMENGNNKSSGLNSFNRTSSIIIYRDEVLR